MREKGPAAGADPLRHDYAILHSCFCADRNDVRNNLLVCHEIHQ
jgi:hypothetical protein